MASNTYVALQTSTLSSAASSVTFSSIPQGYTDLQIVINAKANTGGSIGLLYSYNGDTGANYSFTYLNGNGSSASSGRVSSSTVAALGDLAGSSSSPGAYLVSINNYSNSTTYKTTISRGNDASAVTQALVGLWRSTAAITSITLNPNSGVQFAAGSTFTLYGIAAASVGAKATGGTIYQDASYFYHVFTGNGTFTPSQSLSCDYLVVAGGGAGGSYVGGGGGAGGYLTSIGGSPLSLSATGYSITVGAGGAGVVATTGSQASNGNPGNNSVFSSVTATGGGYGGGGSNIGGAGGAGGSGGGGAGNNLAGSRTGGSGSQGNAGGTGNGSAPNYPGAGGGGAGTAGQAGQQTSQGGGNGGDGLNTLTTWVAATGTGASGYYAGGGGGASFNGTAGAGGAGGGGAGNNSTTATSGTANTGGGGGGSNASQTSGNGGSGIVIVRYAK